MKTFSMLAFAVVAVALASGCCCCRNWFRPPATCAVAPPCNTCNTCPTPTYAAPAVSGYSPAPAYDYGTYGAAPAYAAPSYGTPVYAAPAGSSCPTCNQ